MTRGSIIRSIFCFLIGCIVIYTVLNICYFFRISGKPELLRLFLPEQAGSLMVTDLTNKYGSLGSFFHKAGQDAKEYRDEFSLEEKVTEYPHQGVRPLKVFMYDLPRKFTYGVVEEYLRARGLLNTKVKNDVKLLYPGNQHSAEWWLFLDLLKPLSERLGSPAVRVKDPRDADVFYVPFFSSLSLVVNPPNTNSSSPPLSSYNDVAMQEELIAWLEKQPTWLRARGRDHVIICQDPNALHAVIDKLKNCLLLLSDFGRLQPEQGSWVKDIVLPYSHRIASYRDEDDAHLERKTLLFFMGNRYRKEGGKVRDELFKELENEEGMVIQHGIQSRESRREASMGMKTSKFCLHPAGDTPSACRLFDAIVSLCVPVIVSDDIELPFEDILDYSEFSIFVPVSKAVQPGFLASTLRAISSKQLAIYQKRLRKVRRYFEYDKANGTVNQIWREVAHKLPVIRTMINREKRLVKQTQECSCICSNITQGSMR